MFQPNRCLCVALRPQKRGAFSARRNAGTLSLRNLGGIQNEIASDFQESIWIKHAVDHKCRDCFGGIQRYVSPLLNSATNIQATGLQSRKKAVPVGLGRDNNHRIPGLKSGPDELSGVIEKTCNIRIE